MGMSSSQARLLTLTARMHDIEYKAQRLEAQKLQMANESRRVYETYLEALDARKIQYKTLNNDGSITYRDASLNALENGAVPSWEGETSNKTFLLINHTTDELYLTPAFAAEYGFENGQELGYDGTLDDFLRENGAHTRTIETWGPDYDNPIAWTPVENGMVELPIEGNPGTTVYGLSGNITPATVPGPGEYTLSETFDDLTRVIRNPSPAQPPSFEPVSGGFSVSELTPVVTGYSVTLPSTYKPITGTSFNFHSQGNSFYQLLINCGVNPSDIGDGTTNITAFINGTAEKSLAYDATQDDLIPISSRLSNLTNTNISFDDGYFSSNGYLSLAIYNDDGTMNEEATNLLYQNYLLDLEYSYDGPQPDITATTTLNQLMYSNQGIGSNNRANMPIITLNGNTYGFEELGISEEAFGNLTLSQYVDRVKSCSGDSSLCIDTSNPSGLQIISNNYAVSLSLNGCNSSTITQNQTQVDINLDALAKNIFLAKAISTNMSTDNYEAGIGDLAELKTKLQGISNISLARIFDDLENAFNTTDDTRIAKIQQVYTAINNYLDNPTGAYNTVCGGRDFSDSAENEYDIRVDYDSQSEGYPSYTPGQAAISGWFSVDHNPADVRLLLAEAVLNDKTQSPSEFLNNPNNIINDLSIKEMACMLSYYGTEQWNSVLEALRNAVNSGRKEDIGDYLTINSSGESMVSWGGSFEGSAQITETPPGTDVTISSSADDILDKLAFDIYNAHKSEYEKPDDVKTALSSIFSESDSRLASISTFVNNPSEWNNIISQLYNQIKGGAAINSQYTNKFEGFDVTYSTEDRISFTRTQEGQTDATPGKVHMPNDAAIISNLEAAFKHAGVSTDAASFISGKSIEQKYMINEIVCEYLLSGGQNNTRFNAMIGGEIPESRYGAAYDYYADISGTCEATDWEQKVIDTREVWDTDELYYQLVDEYNLLQKFAGLKVKIIEEPLASSVDFVSNFLTFDEAYIVEFDKNTHDLADTSVATNTNLQEVADEKDLKKAEAKYEADMKRIDMKDRRYDTQLAALDNERNAVKQEMETLKTVAKDNVDRTFRLFS